MDTIIKELFIGLVGGIGVDFCKVIDCFKKRILLSLHEFEPHIIKLSELMGNLKPKPKLETDRINRYMDRGTELRTNYKNNSILASFAVLKIWRSRKAIHKKKQFKVVYIINSLKRPEEAELLRKIYGRNFILVSVHASFESRQKAIEYKDLPKNRDKIKALIEKDFQETNKNQKEYGQNVSGTFT